METLVATFSVVGIAKHTTSRASKGTMDFVRPASSDDLAEAVRSLTTVFELTEKQVEILQKKLSEAGVNPNFQLETFKLVVAQLEGPGSA